MTNSFHERRQYDRVPLLAYGQGKNCILEIGGRNIQADLIDISAGGARVRMKAPLAAGETKNLVFSVSAVDDKGLLQKLPAVIRWQSGPELGVQFVEQLDVAVSTLQRMVC